MCIEEVMGRTKAQNWIIMYVILFEWSGDIPQFDHHFEATVPEVRWSVN